MITVPKHYFPSPWQLKGEGVILTYLFKKDWVEAHGFLPDYLRGRFAGGLGFVMLVNYRESPVGAYKELLFIPGKFSHTGKYSITKIYVDSQNSTNNGRYNWGIPKETATIGWEKSDKADHITLSLHGNIFFNCRITSGGLPFPVHTFFLPLLLYQYLNEQTYLTNPRGKGLAKLARIKDLRVNQELFPDISRIKPLASIRISPFQMHFPKAVINGPEAANK
jgi:hypothetical protein